MNSLVSENLSCSSGPGQNIDRHKISKKEQLIIYIFSKNIENVNTNRKIIIILK